MPETRSINQNHSRRPLPDFRNLGAVLRILLLVNGIAFLAVASQASSLAALQNGVLQSSALLQPALLTTLLLLYGLNPVLGKMGYWPGVLTVAATSGVVTLVIEMLGGDLFALPGDIGMFHYWRHALGSVTVALLLLAYFRLRAQALSPAIQEARLQALQARIRPHFLFNTINAVLSIVRTDPRRAETVLEDMADLFRMAMAEPREQVPLSREVELAQQYLAIEALRLGERLKVAWDIREMPSDAFIPPLILQPLLENAVYHGIEPLPEGGTIEVRLYRSNAEMHLEVSNPSPIRTDLRPAGNKMALSNIRERLALLFDVEADYQVKRDADRYHVHIIFPYTRGAPA